MTWPLHQCKERKKSLFLPELNQDLPLPLEDKRLLRGVPAHGLVQGVAVGGASVNAHLVVVTVPEKEEEKSRY